MSPPLTLFLHRIRGMVLEGYTLLLRWAPLFRLIFELVLVGLRAWPLHNRRPVLIARGRHAGSVRWAVHGALVCTGGG